MDIDRRAQGAVAAVFGAVASLIPHAAQSSVDTAPRPGPAPPSPPVNVDEGGMRVAQLYRRPGSPYIGRPYTSNRFIPGTNRIRPGSIYRPGGSVFRPDVQKLPNLKTQAW